MLINNVFIKKLKIPVYGSSLWVVISDNIPRAIDTIEDLIDKRIEEDTKKKSYGALSYAYEDHDGRYRLMIFLKNNASAGEVAHEANHTVNTVLLWHGVKPSFTNDEAECYLLERIVDKVHNVLKQYHKAVSNENNKKNIDPRVDDGGTPMLPVGTGGHQAGDSTILP